jgi:hypothetical protein
LLESRFFRKWRDFEHEHEQERGEAYFARAFN